MSKFLLDYFERETSSRHRTVYFFFSNQDEKRQSAISFLKAAIHQFIQYSTSLFKKYVKVRLTTFGDGLYASFGLLWGIFRDMTQDPGLGRVYCVLDALDECEAKSRHELINCIGRHFSPSQELKRITETTTHFKFIITSRPNEDILASWSRFHIIHLRTELEEPLINNDIALFVESEADRLAKLRNYCDELKQQVQIALINVADRMFLWTALMVKVLESTSIARVPESLKRLPNGIEALYDRVLAEIPEDSLDTVSSILKWVVFPFRPLTVEELSIVCALDSAAYKSPGSMPSEIKNAIEGDLRLCGTILKIKENSVHLVHQTTREHLIKRSAMDSAVERFLLPPQQAHSRMALTCLTILDFEELEGVETRLRTDTSNHLRTLVPFSDYAGSHWGSHIRESGPISDGTDLWKVLLAILKSAPKLHLLEILAPMPFKSYVRHDILSSGDRCSPLHLLIDYGCHLASEIYARTQRFKASDRDRHGKVVLHMAAERGFAQLVEIILTAEGDPNLFQTLRLDGPGGARQSKHYNKSRVRTPLHFAAAEGHERVVQILFRSGADPNAEDTTREYYEVNYLGGTRVIRIKTALHLATAGNHKSTVRLLLDNQAQIDAMET